MHTALVMGQLTKIKLQFKNISFRTYFSFIRNALSCKNKYLDYIILMWFKSMLGIYTFTEELKFNL